jgi:hypothetical protein
MVECLLQYATGVASGHGHRLSWPSVVVVVGHCGGHDRHPAACSWRLHAMAVVQTMTTLVTVVSHTQEDSRLTRNQREGRVSGESYTESER